MRSLGSLPAAVCGCTAGYNRLYPSTQLHKFAHLRTLVISTVTSSPSTSGTDTVTGASLWLGGQSAPGVAVASWQEGALLTGLTQVMVEVRLGAVGALASTSLMPTTAEVKLTVATPFALVVAVSTCARGGGGAGKRMLWTMCRCMAAQSG